MDFDFVPSGTGDSSINAARQFLHHRVAAAGHVPVRRNNLQDIVDFVDTTVPAGQKIEKVFILSHASPDHVSFNFTKAQSDPSVYTTLIKTIDTAGAFVVPPKFKAVPPSGSPRISVIIKGCRVGASEAFTRLLK